MYQNTYNIGDVVLRIDSATKVGQSSKLRSPWKGPYIVTEVKLPVLFKIIDKRNRETVVHHDRIKLCQDLDYPSWVKRIRNKIFDENDKESKTSEGSLSH